VGYVFSDYNIASQSEVITAVIVQDWKIDRIEQNRIVFGFEPLWA